MGRSHKGSLATVRPDELAALVVKEAIERAGIEPGDVQHSIFGNVIQSTSDTVYFARHVALKSGCPIESSALTVNRLCGSGFQAVVSAAQDIRLGDADVCLVGGGESMSTVPHAVRGVRWGIRLGQQPPLEDLLWDGLTDRHAGVSMGQTAENIAKKYGLDRGCVDEFALRSQQLARDAWAAGVFDDEVIPVPVKNTKTGKVEDFRKDEHMRPETTAEALTKLRPTFAADGVVTAGNASGIGDGGAALVVASAAWAAKRGLKPLARLVSWGYAGVDPTIMGMGPVPASRIALERAGMTLDQMDFVEVNEAFAPQACAVEREMGIRRDRLNVHGGAIALSHPLGASGARITAHLLHALRRDGKRFALGSACIGGGQGIALVVEATA